MYRPAGLTRKISKRTQREIREIHRALPVMLLFFLAESDVDGPGQGHAPDLGERVMRMSSSAVAPSAVAILATALLCGLGVPAMSQTTPSTALPSVTVVAPKEVTRPHRPVQSANTGVGRRAAPAARTSAQRPTRTAPPAPGSVMAKFAAIERTSSNCNDGCETSFKYRNQPWNGCSTTGAVFGFSVTCRNGRNYKTYFECRDGGLFLGARNNEVWWYCSSLLAGGKLAGEKFVEMRTLRY